MFDIRSMKWTRPPKTFSIRDDSVEIITEPRTDLWQRTYYHFRNDNAPALQAVTEERFFSFSVKTEFESSRRFDQCGIIMYLDSDNWLKASVEYENELFQQIGSVVTSRGYSDWATAPLDPEIRRVWYRLSRREDDFRVERSLDGENYFQMRVCHMPAATGAVPFGVYACSPEDSSFKATFSDMRFGECLWEAHDGQQPDEE